MSKNFELLQRVAKENYFKFPEEPVPPPKKPTATKVLKTAPPDPEITKLIQRLFSQAGKGEGPKVVCFSGISRDDRSSWICARAGETLAEQTENSVCMVDANLSSPQLHKQLAVVNKAGMAEALTTKIPIENFVMPLSRHNLWLVPAGLIQPGLYPSLERYRERFAELRATYDYVLVSAPAITSETEATFLGQLADGVVLIVEANQSRRETVRRAKEQLESANVRLLGAVLDQRTFPIPEKLYRRL